MGKRSRVKVDEIAKDWISNLPDEIIHFIMSFLTLKEAGRTSILSHRWRVLWGTSTDLSLDVLNVMDTDYSNKKFRKKARMTVAEKKVLQKERLEFIRRVGKILPHHRSPIINSFKIRFFMDIDFSHQINSWLQTAIMKRATKVDINLSEFQYYRHLSPSVDELYTFPDWVFPKETAPCVKYLSLNYCIFAPPQDSKGFKFLIVLRLETVYLSDKNIEDILSISSYLERLSLINCWKLENLKITGKNLVLKYLTVAECYSLGKIEIDAVNLIKFKYYGIPVGLAFQNVPQLVNVVIYTVQQNIVAGISYALGALSTDLPQLQSLLLHAEPIERSMIPERLPTFANLKQLVLLVSWVKGSLLSFLSVLQTAPYLERFELHLPFELTGKKVKRFKKATISPLVHLKEVVFSGLVGSPDEVDFVSHLVSNAEAINTVTIFSADRTDEYDAGILECLSDRLSRLHVDDAASRALRRMKAEFVGKQIKKVLSPGAKLIIK